MITHDDIPSRTCKHCNLASSDLELFCKGKRYKYGRRNLCHVCANKQATAWVHANPEQATANHRAWSLARREKTKQRTKAALDKLDELRNAKSVGLALETKQRMAAAVKKLNVIRKARREGGNHETG